MDEVLVTGASGFIGSHLCRRLLEEGYSVHGVDIQPPRFEPPDSVTTKTVDLTDTPRLPEVDVIVHLAAYSQVQPIVEDTELAVANISMTEHVLKEAKRMGAAVIHASSRDVYGNKIAPPESEVTSDTPNPYAASKLGSEALTSAFRHTYDVQVANLRLSNVYGPRDINQRVIPIFIALAEAGEQLQVFGKEKLLDFIHVTDVCAAIVESIRRINVINGEVINVGSGSGTPLTDVAEIISKRVDSCPGWETAENRNGDVNKYVSDISAATRLLNWEPDTPLKDGLNDTVEWYQNHPQVVSDLL